MFSLKLLRGHYVHEITAEKQWNDFIEKNCIWKIIDRKMFELSGRNIGVK